MPLKPLNNNNLPPIGSSEKENSVNWFDQTWLGRGIAAASTTGEASDVFLEGSNVTLETVQDFIRAREQQARTYVESERMKRFMKQYNDEGKTWTAFFRGVRKNPGLMPELFVQSLGTQLGTAFDSPEALATGAGTAVAGALTAGPLGAIAGLMGGLATGMETALTLGELIEEELKKQNKPFTDENVLELLQSDLGSKIRNRALGRGVAIGAIESLSGGLAGKAAQATKGLVGTARSAKKAYFAGGVAGTAVEAAGGATGEVVGRLAADQEMDPAEIGFEAITGTVTAPATVGYSLLTAKPAEYVLNKEKVTYQQMKKFVDEADPIDIATADIQIKNDFTGVGKKAEQKQEIAREQAKLSGDEDVVAEVKKAEADEVFEASMSFAKKHSNLYGLKFIDNLTNDEIIEKYGEKYRGANGFVINDEIIINKEVAQTKGIEGYNTGNHELLHGIIKASKTDISQKTIDEFLKIIGPEAEAVIEKRINDAYSKQYMLDNPDEYFTIFSDAIETGDIKFNETLFTKIQDFIRRLFASLGYSNVDFNNARSTYNFLKDYNRSIHKGALSTGLKRATEGTAFFEEGVESRSKLVDDINKMAENVTTKEEFLSPKNFNPVYKSVIEKGGAINNYIRSLNLSPELTQKTIDEVSDRLLNYNPQAERKTESGEPITLGEFVMANVGFSQLEGRKSLAIEGERARRETSVDVGATTQEGDIQMQIEDTSMVDQDLFDERQQEQNTKPIFSKLRRKLGIQKDSDFYNSILESARKALIRAYDTGDTARNIQRSLQNEANTYLFKTVKNFLGAGNYISNLKQFREAIVDAIFTADLVQLEREVADADRVFTKFDKKLTSKQEVQDAVNKKLLPKQALNVIDKGQSVNLYKKVMPTEEQFIKFFDQPAINPKTGKRSGLKGTRKDGLSKYLAGALNFDATMQVAQEDAVIQKRQQIADLKNVNIPENDLQVLSDVIDRPVNLKLSRSSKRIVKNDLEKAILKLNKNDIAFGNQLQFIETALRDFDTDPLAALEKAFIAIKDTITNEADKAFLSKIVKEGIVDKNYIKNILENTKKIYVKDIRKYGYNATINRLRDRIKKADQQDRANILISFLKNESKSIRTSKASGITRNSQVFETIIKPLAEEYKITGFEVKKLEGTFVKDNETINYTKIAYNGNEINTYTKVTDIKKDFKSFINTIDSESQAAIDYIIDILEDTTLSKLEQKSIIKLLSVDQVGVFRKMSKAGMYIENLPTSKTTLDHETTINDLYLHTVDYIDNVKDIEKLKTIYKNSRVNLIPKEVDKELSKQKLKSTGADRMHNEKVKKVVDKFDFKDKDKVYGVSDNRVISADSKIKQRSLVKASKSKRGMSTFDFDETLIIKGENFITATKGDKVIKVSSEEWPTLGDQLKNQGYKFNFDDFIQVRGGVEGPLLQKMRNQINKFGTDNVYVLTARPPQSAEAIHAWLNSKGINIPLENITGLGDSTGEAKARWMLEKFSQGYNDMYFADDALQNVEAVKNVLEQLDVKSKVVQAKLSKSAKISDEFNKILEETKGIKADKRFSDAAAKRRGKGLGRYKFFIPPSHEDLAGLLYSFMGKGEAGNRHRAFFEENILKPLIKSYRQLNTAKQVISTDYKNLIKQNKNIRDLLTKEVPTGDFSYSDAVRVYLWDKFGFKIPGLDTTEQKELVDLINSNDKLKSFADTIGKISRIQEGYIEPGEHWITGDIRTDLADATGRVGRKKYFTQFNENIEAIFTKDNLNKIRAIYGDNFVEALQDMLYRVENGTNRKASDNRIVNGFLDYLNGSIGATMFINVRSAVLQQLSVVNFINFADNNIFAAAKAFANQKQFWSDYITLFNSPYLKQRRAGAGFDLNTNELVQTIGKSKNPARALIQLLLQKGFTPTQIADSNAIALGGASFYRNRVKTYLKQGLSQQDADSKAFIDFQDIAEETQQSARPYMLSQQQASVLGRVVLAFQNTPSQYARIIKKSILDLVNRRKSKGYATQVQSDTANISRILYYGAMQNLIFYTLQSGLFALMFSDDERDEKMFNERREYVLNGISDSLLRGMGVGGALISTIKNLSIKYKKKLENNWRNPIIADELWKISVPTDIKKRKITRGERILMDEKKKIDSMSKFDINNPMYEAIFNIVEGTTNLPLARMHYLITNTREAFNDKNTWWQRIFLAAGWSEWNLGMEENEKEQVRKSIKDNNKKLPKIGTSKKKLRKL